MPEDGTQGVSAADMYPLERAIVTHVERPRPGLARVLVRALTASHEEPAHALDPIAATLELGEAAPRVTWLSSTSPGPRSARP